MGDRDSADAEKERSDGMDHTWTVESVEPVRRYDEVGETASVVMG